MNCCVSAGYINYKIRRFLNGKHHNFAVIFIYLILKAYKSTQYDYVQYLYCC